MLKMKRLLPLLFLIGFFTNVRAQDPSLKDTMKQSDVNVVPVCKQIIGYYPSWQMYKRGGLVVPATLNYDKYTILKYSTHSFFFKVVFQSIFCVTIHIVEFYT